MILHPKSLNSKQDTTLYKLNFLKCQIKLKVKKLCLQKTK